ncbi:hypothetical protein EAO69_23495 [Streptomyces sp. me109]|nr:hypothetical protein EAO69_23495 [Streptomyces sp. me109]
MVEPIPSAPTRKALRGVAVGECGGDFASVDLPRAEEGEATGEHGPLQVLDQLLHGSGAV